MPGTGTVYIDAKLSVIRERAVGDGFHEELTILNHETSRSSSRSGSTPASDFADLFEVKDALKKVGDYATRSRTAGCGWRTSARRSGARPSSPPRRRPASTSTA